MNARRAGVCSKRLEMRCCMVLGFPATFPEPALPRRYAECNVAINDHACKLAPFKVSKLWLHSTLSLREHEAEN